MSVILDFNMASNAQVMNHVTDWTNLELAFYRILIAVKFVRVLQIDWLSKILPNGRMLRLQNRHLVVDEYDCLTPTLTLGGDQSLFYELHTQYVCQSNHGDMHSLLELDTEWSLQ